MSLNKITNFVIAALVVLSIFLTGRLWFDDFSNHNLFYSALGNIFKTNIASNVDLEKIEPKRVIVDYGNKKFSVVYYGSSSEGITDAFSSSLNEIFESGKFDLTETLDFTNLLTPKSVILEYSFKVSASEYLSAFKDVSSVFSDKLQTFDYIAIIPSSSKNGRLDAVFVNTSSNEAQRFYVEKSNTTQELYSAIEEEQSVSSGMLSYISTAQNSFNMFASDVFVPQWKSGEYKEKTLSKINPYTKGGKIDEEAVYEATYGFFGGGSTVYSDNSKDGIFILNDDTKVIKYYSTGILEYYNYESMSGTSSQNLSEAYTVCREFISKDKTLSSDIYLSSAEFSSDGLIFYFDYAIDNIPITFSKELMEETGISHAVEVVVKNNLVKNYRRYVPYYSDSVEEIEVSVDFIGVIDKVMSQLNDVSQESFINDISLSYLDTGEEKILLYWTTLIDEDIYEVKACE